MPGKVDVSKVLCVENIFEYMFQRFTLTELKF